MSTKFIANIIFAMIFLLGLAAGGLMYSERNKAFNQLAQTRELNQKLKQDLEALQGQKTEIEKEKDKLQKDALAFIELNTKLKEEKDQLQESVVNAQKMVETKESELERLNYRLKTLEAKASKDISVEKEALDKQRRDLTDKIIGLEKLLKKERALYNYNLGVAYSRVKSYDEAIESFEKALKIDPDMADAHYNLGLLYENVERDQDKAVGHYRRYLKLVPDSLDRDEIQASIMRLSEPEREY